MGTIADKYDCTVEEIKRWNKRKSSKVVQGQKLLVFIITRQKVQSAASTAPKAAPAQSKQVKSSGVISTSAQSAKIIWHVVQPGDTLWKIANRYDGVTVQDIKNQNMLNSNNIQPGTKLKLKIAG
jgi:membrane-bound lytic murein transglycosylase D